MKKHLLFLTFLLTSLSVFSQNTELKYPAIKFRNFSMGDGLSMSTIMSAAQTKDGYLWFATPDKLNRYDGYEFKAFRHEQGVENSLSENFITSLLALPDGSLLIAGISGYIDRYVPKYNNFTHFDIWEGEKEITEIRGFCLLDSLHVAVYTMGNGFCKLNIKTGDFVWFNSDNSLLSSYFVQAFIKISDKQFAYATDAGIGFYFPENDSIPPPSFLKETSITCMAVYNGKLYAGSHNSGLFKVDLKTEAQSKVKLGEKEDEFTKINLLLPDSKGNLWVGTTFDGVLKISKDGSISLLRKVASDINSLINNTLYSALEDNGGNIWFGTISGISAYMPLNQQFAFYRPNPEDPYAMSNRQVYSLFEDNQNQIWLGTLEGGVNRFDPKTQRFTVFNRQNSKGLTSNSIRSVYQDKKQRYWVGTGDKGLFRFYPNENKFEAALDQNGELISTTSIRSIYDNNSGWLWIGTEMGLIAWNPETKEKLSGFETANGDYPPQIIYEIKPGRNSSLFWIASFGQGLFEFDHKLKIFTKTHTSIEADSFALNNNNIMCLKRLGNDTLLIGTFGGGINIYDLKKNRFTSFTENDGLPNDAVYGLLVDRLGNWWLSSNKGIAKVEPHTKKVIKFDKNEQVQSLEFNEGAYLACSKGLFYFGGIEGLNVFNPLEIKVNKTPPLIHLSRVSIFDKTLLNMWDKNIKLSHNQNFIGFEYVGIGLLNPDKLTYSYMLEGVDEDWQEVGSRRFVQYTALRPGEYVFKVKAINQEGISSEQTVVYPFVIMPPYWLTWWFLGLVGLSFILVVLYGYKFRTNRIRKEYQLKVTEVELKALRSQMNPHFIFNSINSIQYYILNQNPKIAYSYLAKFSSLMRKILQNSRVNYISLAEELESLQLYVDLENIRLEGELNYTIELDPKVDTKSILIPSMILQPFIENAIVHGLLNKEGDKQIMVKVSKEVSHIYCEIEDNGIGREKAKELNANRTKKHESTAMKATKERLELLNIDKDKKLSINIIDLYDSQGNPSGTKVQVFIPFVKEK